MTATFFRFQISSGGPQGRHWFKPFLLALLLVVLPMTASAQPQNQPFWCKFFPLLCPVIQNGSNGPLTEVSGFGSNPGNLKMFTYRPANLAASRPLVVVMHGCVQQASGFDDETGWIKFADKHQFALLLPQQQPANSFMRCFNWSLPGDNVRDRGEALSIRQMIDRIKTDANIDPQKIYATGLSAGGAMTAVMLAAYPEVFAGGAIIAGIPYKCANTVIEAQNPCMAGTKNLTPTQWGNLVRNASSHTGKFPRVSIWQGASDTIVNALNQQELVDQWTDVLGIDQTPDTADTINGYAHKLYKDSSGTALVETVLVNDMDHGIAISPGDADDKCGKAAPYILNVGVCASSHIVKFWGL